MNTKKIQIIVLFRSLGDRKPWYAKTRRNIFVVVEGTYNMDDAHDTGVLWRGSHVTGEHTNEDIDRLVGALAQVDHQEGLLQGKWEEL